MSHCAIFNRFIASCDEILAFLLIVEEIDDFSFVIDYFVVLGVGKHFDFAVELGSDFRVCAEYAQYGMVLLLVDRNQVIKSVIAIDLNGLGLLYLPLSFTGSLLALNFDFSLLCAGFGKRAKALEVVDGALLVVTTSGYGDSERILL
jgi:hypothetical protein